MRKGPSVAGPTILRPLVSAGWTLAVLGALMATFTAWWLFSRPFGAVPSLVPPQSVQSPSAPQAAALTRTGRGPGDIDVTVALVTPEFLRGGLNSLPEWANPTRHLIFLVQEDLHGRTPVSWSPTLRVGSEVLEPLDARIIADAGGHHRLGVVLYSRYDAQGGDRLAAPSLEVVLPPAVPGAPPEALRWDRLMSPSPAAQVPLRPTSAALLGLFGGFLASMWPCLFQLTAYFIPGLAGLTMAQARGSVAERGVRLQVMRTALFFVLGIVIVYTIGGTVAGLAAQSLSGTVLFAQWRRPLMVAGALVILVMAARVAVRARSPLFCKMPVVSALGRSGPRGPLGTMALGLAFATGCMTCFGATMALGSVTYIFSSGSVLTGALVMFLFSLGIAVPLVVAAAAMARVMPLLMRLERWRRWLVWGSSAVMVAFALLLLTDTYHLIGDWARLPTAGPGGYQAYQ